MVPAAHNVPRLDRAGLRQFGLITGLGICVLFGALLPLLLKRPYPLWPWVTGGVLVTAALIVPNVLRWVYTPWMWAALLINRLTSPLIGGAVFFLVMTPVAFIMRRMGNDPMARSFDRDAGSYRIQSRQSPGNMRRPF